MFGIKKVFIKPKNLNENLSQKPKEVSMLFKRCFRTVLWVMIIWIFGKGVYSVFNHSVSTQAAVNSAVQLAQSENDAAKTFAISFARQYFTVDVVTTDPNFRANKLSPFVGNSNDKNFGLETIAGKSMNQIVAEASVWKVKKIDEKHSLITVRALVRTEKSETTYYLAVPVVALNDQSYQVYDLPSIVAGAQRVSDPQKQQLDGEQLAPEDQTAITDMLRGYFQAYVKGTPSDISYYFPSDVTSATGLNSTLIYKDIKDIKVVRQKNDEVKAEVTLVIQDPQSNEIYLNRYTLDLVKDGKWFIKSMLP